MARSKDWETFPEEFHTLLREGATREIVLDLGSIPEARRMLGTLYGFHSAIKVGMTKPPGPRHGLLMELDSLRKRVKLGFLDENGVPVGVTAGGPKIAVYPNDLSPTAVAIREALERAGVQKVREVSVNPSADFMERLGKLKPDEQ